MSKLISVDEFRAEMRAKRPATGGVFRVVTEDPVADENSRKIRFCFSDGSVDRMGDTIDPNGWDLRDFNANPVALWAHDSSQPPIGRASNVSAEGARLMGDIEFMSPETYAFADTIYRMVREKFLNAVSVGFIPLEYSFVENDPDRGWGIDFKRQQLLEISVCPVPANPNALADARAKGIDTRPLREWAERALDIGGGNLIISKTELNALRKAAKEPSMAKRTTGAVQRADDDDKPAGNCGRAADDECGMKSHAQCSVHSGSKAADDDDDDKPDAEKGLRALLLKLLAPKRRDADDKDPDDAPLAHEDAIRMAHKCLRTSKAFLTEGLIHHNKAVDLLGDVVDAIDDAPDDDDKKPVDEDEDAPSDDDDAATAKAKQKRRAAKLIAKYKI